MFGRRIFVNVLQKNVPCWKPVPLLLKPWSQAFSITSRLSIPSPSTKPATDSLWTENLNKIASDIKHNKVFKKGNNKQNESTTISSLSAKLFSALGVLFGVGGLGAAYHTLVGKENAFEQFLVQCECGSEEVTQELEGGEPVDGVQVQPEQAGPICCKPKTCEGDCLRAKQCEEDRIMCIKAEFERAITDTKSKVIDYVEEAMELTCEALPLMQEYLANGYRVIDNDAMQSPEYEKMWCCVYEIAKERCCRVKVAMEKISCAWELLCRLREIIEAGKECDVTKSHPLIPIAEYVWECSEKELLELQEKMKKVESGRKLMEEQYRDVIAKFREDLKPDVAAYKEALECCTIEHEAQERAILIQAAYLRAIRLQKELAQVLVCEKRVTGRARCTCC